MEPESSIDAVARLRRNGRGAASNRSGRFERERRVAVDDGWGVLDDPLPPLRTTVGIDTSRVIIARNRSPDLDFDRSINPYRGCEHGCAYCYARPSHAYLGLSPGHDFESRLFAKPEAAKLLRAELARPGYRCRMIAMGTNTDPYQPVERQRRITRALLEVLAACDHPVGIVTKSALVTRDLDILAPMAAKGLVKVALSVTTLDRALARRLEPRASTPLRRLEAMRVLSQAGVPTMVMAAPMIPGLNDPELDAVLEAASAAGAAEAGYILLRLPREVAALFKEWLAVNEPLKAARVMALIRDTRGGRDYDSQFATRMVGSGPYAEALRQRFHQACKRFGLSAVKGDRRALDTGRFRPPPIQSDQLTLF